ncbi:MAG TPA: ferrous iron transport protein B [Anaerolinea thermolimosa]|uniref:Ferrous iron transport protein B n=1 Tax=Anaerolinea thermolimosa TaxID=229919 RepID=A0A3D1JDT3_9CHLR|nr:ferrous iron transport protein B [Anaerolinea thermolimosa]GAP07589.1 ferrous iron transporter FeoB [Anaerolinea thermolimosa]HCE16682.1 ferrous iron transport protein B [Anaerolinea thermolimosa]
MSASHTLSPAMPTTGGRIALVGNPNVGKSILFHRLTGQYVTVSNYPGTTVEITRGVTRAIPGAMIIDTPGIVTFPARSEDEAVTARVLLQDPLQAVLQVGDAKNLRRTLHLTVQLAEMGLPIVLALNMIDEAEARGLKLDPSSIADALGMPVISTIATRGQGMHALVEALKQAPVSSLRLEYPQPIEDFLSESEGLFPPASMSPRALGLLWLAGDRVVASWLAERLTPATLAHLQTMRTECESRLGVSPLDAIQRIREDFIQQVVERAIQRQSTGRPTLQSRLSRLTTHPLGGLAILALVLYALYWFVGVFGAGTLVGLLENHLFDQIINPWITDHIQRLIPWKFAVEMLVGEYGLWTMGATYAFALLLPVVTTFFIAFGVLEDSGYLPRMAVLTNRFFSWMGLNGQAVLPMVLGLGCVTMATMTTRTLPSRRERLLVTILLALAVPCSAQLGVVLGMLAGISFSAALIWGGVVLGVLLLVGWLAARLMPGERAPLVVELPPLRLPVLSNVLVKTAARLEWYIKEAVPLFLVGTLLLFTLDQVHILPWLIHATEPVVTDWLGLPPEAASAFLLGIMRRDFAATGLFHMQNHGLLSPLQVVVSIVTITLFVPCIASIFMIAKERGWRTTLGILLFVFPFALLVGGVLYRLLLLFGWS